MTKTRKRKTNTVKKELPDLPVAKNEEVVTEIIGLTHDGQGVGRVNGFTLFVHGALPGEKVRAKVLKLKKQYGYAKMTQLLEASPDRVAPPCAIYDQCGGCQLQHLSYEAQLRMKRKQVVDNLVKIGKLQVNGEADGDAVAAAGAVAGEGVEVLPTLGMQDPWRYRNKALVPIGEREGGLVGGFYAANSHRIIDMDTCLIQHGPNDDVIRTVKRIGEELGITAYDEETGKGLLRHVMVRTGYVSDEMMVVLVTNGDRIPKVEEWTRRIVERMPQVKSICQSVNTKRTNVALGDVTKVLWGREVIYDSIGPIRFAISARSFYQVNPVQTEVLYGKALEYAQLTGEETVIDAYCGIGTISLFLAQKARKVYGVEIVEQAIEDAKANAELNGIRNADFAAGAAEEVIPAWRAQGIAADVIVVDPPRKGCDAALLETIIAMQPKRVVYVSCNPSTLARDLRILEDGGFQTLQVQPVDMFPHTGHVECCSLLVRKD
ncbi:23S rRNA (uracil(1939)-C(5))-methyltransferase RlmD [Marinicrinis lubricantis]|uniref:23S rRNA (Uracil(1939)-C(5))-methyltransferase RlmD n=1 Tax=Marinicrinis lubricantis TaxID=2086470 RepID=A0ABW1IU78_9BACL